MARELDGHVNVAVEKIPEKERQSNCIHQRRIHYYEQKESERSTRMKAVAVKRRQGAKKHARKKKKLRKGMRIWIGRHLVKKKIE